MKKRDQKFPYHSLKANSVQVFGPIVPKDIGSTVGAGCTPVLDLCHLWRRRDEKADEDITGRLVF